MIHRCDCDEHSDNRAGAQVSPPAPALQRVRIDESVRSRAAEAENVAMLEFLFSANAVSVDEGAGSRFEIDDVVTAARVSDERMTIGDVRSGDFQR